jgi:hypothetical protein
MRLKRQMKRPTGWDWLAVALVSFELESRMPISDPAFRLVDRDNIGEVHTTECDFASYGRR